MSHSTAVLQTLATCQDLACNEQTKFNANQPLALPVIVNNEIQSPIG